jgi:hypothetical protein
MSDTVFRTKIEPVVVEESKVEVNKDKSTTQVSDNIEVPYTDYSREHNHPYLVEHFKLGDTWNDPVGGFPKEIERIESYVKGKIESGEVANSVTAIKELLRHMEKFNNLRRCS